MYEHPNLKLTRAKERLLRALHARGVVLTEIAVRLDVGITTIKTHVSRLGLKRGKGWKPAGYASRMSKIIKDRNAWLRSLGPRPVAVPVSIRPRGRRLSSVLEDQLPNVFVQ